MESGSINRTISFLGLGSADRTPRPSRASNRAGAQAILGREPHVHEHEPATRTTFSDAALERAESQHLLDSRDPNNTASADQLSQAEQSEILKLKQRDQEVRRHEQAHKAAAGGLASGAPTFGYQRGPDGKQYAISGEVQIDVSPVAGDPAATIRKMRQVASAARAPANPSSTDLKVAANAVKQEAAARAELRQQKTDERSTETQTHTQTMTANTPNHDRTSAGFTRYAQTESERRGGSLDLVA